MCLKFSLLSILITKLNALIQFKDPFLRKSVLLFCQFSNYNGNTYLLNFI